MCSTEAQKIKQNKKLFIFGKFSEFLRTKMDTPHLELCGEIYIFFIFLINRLLVEELFYVSSSKFMILALENCIFIFVKNTTKTE